MIEKDKIKEGLYFTLPCEWDDDKQRFVYVLDERNGEKMGHYARSTNVIFCVQERELFGNIGLVEVSVCDYDFIPFICIGLDIIIMYGTEVKVTKEDEVGFLDAYLQATKVNNMRFPGDDKLLYEENKLKIMLNSFFNRDFRNRYNQKRIGE